MAGDFNFNVKANVQDAIAALDRLSEQFDKLEKKFNVFEKMNNAAMALGATLTASAYEAMSFADEITDLAKANDMAVGSVLALGEALAQNGGNAESAAKMLQTLSNNVDAANGGNLNLASTFSRLGVSMADLGTLSNQEIRDKLLDNIAKIADPMERNAKAVEIFGKSMVGVDIKKFAEDQKANRAEMEKYAPALESAGNAWDKLAKMAHDAKIAFTVAFKPIFDFIDKLDPSIDSLVTKFRLMGAAFAAFTSAAAIGQVLKLAEAFGILNAVVGKNPILKIATTILSLGAGVAAYVGMTSDANEVVAESVKTEKDASDVTAERKRNQTGLNDAIKKEHDSLTQIRETLEKNWKLALDKYDIEASYLALTEDEKKVAQDKAKIDEDAKNALFALQQKFDAMDTATRARQSKTYQEEKDAIAANAEAQKKAVESRISDLQRITNELKTVQAAYSGFAAEDQKIFEARTKQQIDTAGYKQRIDLETKLEQITAQRSAMMSNVSKLSEEDRASAIGAINEVTKNVDLLKESHAGVTLKIQEGLDDLVKSGTLTQKIRDDLIKGISLGNLGNLADELNSIAAESRTFNAGWSKAFNEYVENATNAASQANKIFTSFAQNMEDHLLKLFKTGKFGWKDFVQSMIDVLMRSQIQKLMANIFSAGSTNGGNTLGKIFGFADGGIIPTNGPVLVGERGPEIISGAGGRSVTPNNQLGGSNITYNINAVDAMSFKQMIAADPSFLYAVSEQGRRSLPGAR